MKVADIKRAACVGGGVIGSSWAIQFAMRGLAVTLYDINDEQLKRSEAQMHKSLDALEQFNAITPERRGSIVAAIRLTTSMEEAVADAQFIQESGPERLEIKQSILAQVEACAAADALYASSTSGLLISDIAAKAAHPERCVGAHPYNPPHLIPLVELTSGDKTDPALLRLAYDFYQSIGKEAVLLRRECPGFIANRLQLALYREVQDLVMRGVCSVEDADKALVYGPGLRWAIFGHNIDHAAGQPRRPDRHGEYAGQLRRPLAGQHGLLDPPARQLGRGGPARRGRGDEALPRPHRPHQRGVRGLPRPDAH